MGVVKPLFVQGVAGFVHDGVEARKGVLLVKTCRETVSPGHRPAENGWVEASIRPASKSKPM